MASPRRPWIGTARHSGFGLGGVSTVRKRLGIQLEGQGRLARQNQIFFRSRGLFDAIPVGQGRHYYCLPDTVLVVQDDMQHFMVNTTTGIGDATDLSWKLAATLAGWGGPGLLASYEQERRPIGMFNRDCAGKAIAGVSDCLTLTCPRFQSVRR